MKIIRRILLFLAIIISVLWIEAVYADMSAPDLRGFEIVVINPDGVDYYDYKGEIKGHLDKDKVVIVEYEYNGQYTIASQETNKYGGHDSIGYIYSLDGFSIVQEEVDPTKLTDDKSITKYDTPQIAKIYADEGVDIYKGPADVYEKVGHIKKDVTLTYSYSVGGFGITHIYVEYNGEKGWIEILDGKVLIQNDVQYIFANEVSTECGTIPRNSITTPKLKTDQWTHKSLFEYNGCQTLLNTFRDDNIFYVYLHNEILSKDVSLYEYADTSSSVVTTIPAGTEVTVLAGKDTLGDPNYVMYIKYNDKNGWAIGEGDIFKYGEPTQEVEEDTKIEDTIKIEDIEIPEPTQNGGSVVMPRFPFSLIVFVILCVFGVSILVATAIVIIVLVNRTKKKNVKEEK